MKKKYSRRFGWQGNSMFDNLFSKYVFQDISRELPSFTWIYKKHIGKGAFGSVDVLENEFGEKIAIKELSKTQNDLILKELTRDTCNRFVLCYYASGYKKNNKNKLIIITEYVDGDELSNIKINKKDIFSLIYSIAIGINFIHKADIIHRDLKPSNIVVEKNTLRPVIIDFGFACKDCKDIVGSFNYMAPEILLGNNNYSNKIDIFSFGVIIYYIITGEVLYTFEDKKNIYKNKINILNAYNSLVNKLNNFNNPYKNLIVSCTNYDPNERPNIMEIINYFENNVYNLTSF